MKCFLTLLLLCSSIAAYTQTPSVQFSPPLFEAPPQSVGMSPDRLARIDSMLYESIRHKQIPGAVALVARNGKIVYHKAFGTANHETGRAFKSDDIFRIASQTKAITATAVMMLWEEGKFRLDDPISSYIPEFGNPQILNTFNEADSSYTTTPAGNPITIRHLLTHTSGIAYGSIDRDDRFKKIFSKAGMIDLSSTIEDNVKKLATLPLHYAPGERYTYSYSMDVLGYFVEILSGMPFDQFLRERLFDPLGMDDTWFYLPASKHDRLVPVQTRENGTWSNFTDTTLFNAKYPVTGAKPLFSGGAGLSSTAEDYATFLQMYLNNGELNGVRILSRTTIQFIMADQIGDLWQGPGKHLGLAFRVLNQKGQDLGGRGSSGAFNWGGYFNTQYFADPHDQIVGILMKQTRGSSNDETSRKFRQLVFQVIDH